MDYRVVRRLKRTFRSGRFKVPLWALALAALVVMGVAGQAVGPVLIGAIRGSTGVVLGQTVLLSSAPRVHGADDSLGTLNDEGSGFSMAVKTQVGQTQRAELAFANNSGKEANATLHLSVPAGIDVQVDRCIGVTKGQLNRDTWLLTITSGGGGVSWTNVGVDTDATDDGYHSSIAVLGPCTVYISYYDTDNGDLRFARTTDGGATWTLAGVDTDTDDDGSYNAIAAVDANTVYISYYDATNGDLRVAKSTDGGTTWTNTGVDTDGDDDGNVNSIAAPNANTIYISYYDATNFDLRFARSTNGGTVWSNAGVDFDDDDDGSHHALSAVDANTIYISYYDTTNADLRYAKSTDGGTTWTTAGVDTDADDDGLNSSVAVVDANTLFISYRDDTNNLGDLRLARSGAGLKVTVESKDEAAPGFFTISGSLAQVAQ